MMRPVSPWSLFTIWLGLGARSWGGGAATLLMIRREVVETQSWLSAEEFTRFWAICQIAPGINLLGLTVLIGWRVGQSWGAALALLGLLLPSVTITAALTALYAGVRELPTMQAALRGVVPATVGLGLLLAWQMGLPLLRQAHAEGWTSLSAALTLMLGAAYVEFVWRPPVIAVLIGAGAIGGAYGWLKARSQSAPAAFAPDNMERVPRQDADVRTSPQSAGWNSPAASSTAEAGAEDAQELR